MDDTRSWHARIQCSDRAIGGACEKCAKNAVNSDYCDALLLTARGRNTPESGGAHGRRKLEGLAVATVKVRILSSAPFDSPTGPPSASRQARSWQATSQVECPERSLQRKLGLSRRALPFSARRRDRRPVSFVYIRRCADGSLYVGHTEDLASREQTHNSGRGASHTAAKRPVQMVYAEEHGSIRAAIKRERQLKRWTVKKKQALIRGDVGVLRVLSKRDGAGQVECLKRNPRRSYGWQATPKRWTTLEPAKPFFYRRADFYLAAASGSLQERPIRLGISVAFATRWTFRIP